jgi:uncharacterized protein YjbI with pentapeptide repeats
MADHKARVRTPLLPAVTLAGLVPGTLDAGAELDGVRFTGDLRGLRAPDVRLLDCELADAVVDKASLRGGSWADSRWLRVRATSVDLAGSVFRDSVWEGCRIGVAEIPGATLARVMLRRCKVDYLSLRQATITDLTIDGCTIGELDLGETRLKRVLIANSDVTTLRLGGSRSEHVTIAGAGLPRIEGLDALRGVRVSTEQAADLATALVAHLGGEVGD